MKFRTQIDATDPNGWREVEADDLEGAAIEALKATKPPLPQSCEVFVVDPASPYHDNGAPVHVHGFKIVRATPEGEQ